jgi:uncharacterized protein (TIGR02145 family)
MKKIFTVLSAVLISASLWAQAPQSFSYQSVIRGTNNVLVVNKPIGMKISLLQGSENGNTVYVETHTPTSNDNGLVSIAIGGGTKDASSKAFKSIDWANGPYFVKTETDPTGGTNYSFISLSQLLSVPYAITSNNGISRVSELGDSLILSNGNSIIIPGLSIANPKPRPTSGYGQNIIDLEGNTYKSVYIGTQQWMAENLKVSKYNDGTTIPNITDNTEWSNLTTGAWCYYNNDAANNDKYGKLYNWYTVRSKSNGNKNVCPTGWHVPTDAEWTVLTDYLGGTSVAGGKLKEVGTTSWNSSNTDATNTTLFSALPGGYSIQTGGVGSLGDGGYWWCSSENDLLYAYAIEMHKNVSSVNLFNVLKKNGFSVRCIRDK